MRTSNIQGTVNRSPYYLATMRRGRVVPLPTRQTSQQQPRMNGVRAFWAGVALGIVTAVLLKK